MSAPSGYALQQAIVTMQKALNGEPDGDGEFHDPEAATEDVEELLARVLRAAVEADAMDAMLKERMLDMATRRDRFAARSDTLRATAFAAMDVLGRQRLELPDLTASIKQNPPRVIITDEAKIPLQYTKTVRTADKTALKAALAVGPVAGAELSNSLPSIQIRTR